MLNKNIRFLFDIISEITKISYYFKVMLTSYFKLIFINIDIRKSSGRESLLLPRGSHGQVKEAALFLKEIDC